MEEWSTYFHKRIPYQEWWMSSDLRKVDKCWRSVAGMFGHSWPENVVPQVSRLLLQPLRRVAR